MAMTIYALGGINPMLSQEKQDKVFNQADADGNGALTEAEFANFTTSEDEAMSDANRAALFNELDTDGDGTLTSAEITAGRETTLSNMQTMLKELGSLQASQAALTDLLGGVSMIDFINGDADSTDVLGLGDWSDILGIDTAADTSSTTLNSLLAALGEDDS